MPITPSISIAGNPLPTSLAGKITKLCYKEGLNFTADTVSFEIADPDGSFRRNFRLKAALPVTVSISSGFHVRQCGTFYIHTVRMRGDKGGGSTISIDCTSTPIKPECSVRTERKSRGSEKTTLKDLASKIAKENGLGLNYQCADNPKIGRADQHDESDLVHLGKHCGENDFLLKIKDNTLWVLDHEALEKQAPVGPLVLPSPGNPGGINGVGGVVSWELNESVEDIYKAAEVAFKDHKTGKTVKEIVQDPGNSDIGTILRDKHNPHDDEDTDLNEEATSTEAD